MSPWSAAFLAALLPAVTFAQPIVATPLAPPSQAAPQPAPLAPIPSPQAAQPPPVLGTPAQPSPPQPGGSDTAQMPAPPNIWLPRSSVVLQMLDKVNAQTVTMTVKVGQSAPYESLTVAAKACDVRPPDQPADAAAFLVITDSHPDASGFAGWMLHSDPSLSMLEHPLYDVRVVACGG